MRIREVKKLFKNFEKLLQERKTTIHRVAVDTGIPPMVLYDWRNGRSTPKVDKLVKIARYFEVPLEDLLEGGENDH